MLQIFELPKEDGTCLSSPSKEHCYEHCYILQPVTGNGKYTKLRLDESKNTGQALQKAAVDLDDVTLSLSKVLLPCAILNFYFFEELEFTNIALQMKDGYRDILKMADNFSAFNQRLKYAHYRPSVPIKSDPRAWWKYAYKVVIDELKKARYVNL